MAEESLRPWVYQVPEAVSLRLGPANSNCVVSCATMIRESSDARRADCRKCGARIASDVTWSLPKNPIGSFQLRVVESLWKTLAGPLRNSLDEQAKTPATSHIAKVSVGKFAGQRRGTLAFERHATRGSQPAIGVKKMCRIVRAHG